MFLLIAKGLHIWEYYTHGVSIKATVGGVVKNLWWRIRGSLSKVQNIDRIVYIFIRWRLRKFFPLIGMLVDKDIKYTWGFKVDISHTRISNGGKDKK
jgi:hypothetical protein